MKHVSKQIVFEDDLLPSFQYTNIATIGSKVYSRARNSEGAPVYVEQKYAPTYYLPVGADVANTHVGYDGTPLIAHTSESLWESRDWLKKFGQTAYGDIQPEYMVLSDTYGSKEVPFDMDRLYIYDIDIETDSEGGFATPEDPFQPVTAITVIWRHMGKMGKVVYGCFPYTVKGDELYVLCVNEEELLLRFLEDFRGGGDYPDIITGWNVQFFDMPYIIRRMQRLFTEPTWIQISPFQRLADRTVTLYGRSQLVMDVKGVAILDYLEVYRKLSLSQRENYRLDTIAHYELKGADGKPRRKLSYKEMGSLKRLYREDFQKFIEYNINDVMLVDELDQKLKYLELVASLAYGAKANFVDCFKQVRLWDIMIYHKLRSEGKQIPPRPEVHTSGDQYAGAYVKDPDPGLYNWVCSFDVASMYPHIIREWNLSPETKYDDMMTGLTVKGPDDKNQPSPDLIAHRIDISEVKEQDVCVAANGVLTRRDVEGFIPNMLKTLYDERIRFKGLMKKAKGELAQEKDPEKQKQLVKTIAACSNQEKVRKVNLNSAYGALGSNYFRFYDRDLAEAVTVTGQYVIRKVADNINTYLNTIFKTGKHDYIIASDTDSVYVQMERVAQLIEKSKPGIDKKQMVEALHVFCEKKIQPIINKTFEDTADYMHVYMPCLSMVRDVIADKAVWTAKKRYMMNVYDSEGSYFNKDGTLHTFKPELKMMGVEAIKSSTPEIVREMLKKSINLIMTGTQDELHAYVKQCEEQFHAAPFEDIAFPRAANDIEKFMDKKKSVPIAVAGAIAFNNAIDRQNLGNKYEKVKDGEKIKFAYLKQPNPFFSHVMSAPHGCPEEWKIESWVDYDTQFQKTFLEPIGVILKCVHWTSHYEASLW